ncbi:MAG: DMT family transporter [Thermoplasmatota archaeon]
MQQKTFGVIAVLLAAMMWAIEPVIAKLSYNQSDFLQTSMIRAFVISVFSLLLVLIARKPLIQKDKQKLKALTYLALFGTLGADLIYYYAMTSIPVVNAVILAHIQPVFIILIGFFILKKESLHTFEYLGVLILMISAMLVTSQTIERIVQLNFGTIGDAMVLLATITWATTALTTRKYLTQIDASVITFYRFSLASLFFLFLVPFVNLTINIYQITVGLVVGIGTISYYAGLKRLKAAQVSGIELAAPVFAAAIGYFVLQENITPLQILGMFMLFIGIYCISRKQTIGLLKRPS